MPKFQKRHYEFLADWLGNASMALYRHTDRVLVAHSLADRLARDNPRFAPPSSQGRRSGEFGCWP